MNQAIMFFVKLFAGTGVFLVGVHVLTENIEQLATARIKHLFGKTADRKFLNVAIGAATTAIIQSSGVTTVLIIGFVNVGVITLFQAAAMIMGANIGTTITAQIAALSAFPITTYIQAFAFLGVMMAALAKKEKTQKTGMIIAGLGTVFVGLSLMSASMSGYKEGIQAVLENISSPLLLFLLGIFLTALVQSSSATTSIIISMSVAGLTIGTGNNEILFVILGTNIGSCVTALMSSMGAGANAKRAGLIHLLFNTFGAVIFYIFLRLWPGFMRATFMSWFGATAVQIAMFHTFFNVVCTLLFLPFTNLLVRITEMLVKDRPEEKKTVYLDERFLETPVLAVTQLTRENRLLLEEAMDTFRRGLHAFLTGDPSELPAISSSINSVNLHSRQIVDYLVKAASENTSGEQGKLISAAHENIGDIIRISEIADNFVKYTRRAAEGNFAFSQTSIDDISRMAELVEQIGSLTAAILLCPDKGLLNRIDGLEEQVDEARNRLMSSHLERLNTGICKSDHAAVFVNVVSNIERLADHLTYIAHSV